MNLRRSLTVATMHARDLGRRRLALAIVILMLFPQIALWLPQMMKLGG